jgi:hypothetical protein
VDLAWVASALGARTARRTARIQSLWGGYGELFRIALDDGRTAIVKWAHPPAGARADASFARKCRSYDVETAFYRMLAMRCDETCRVAALLAARTVEREWILVLEDLDVAGFTLRSENASRAPLTAALGWLASFHAGFLGERHDGVWATGTYWHLATRQDELAAIRDPVLRAEAPELAARLAAARYQTLLHGDAKEANFCWTREGRVAAVDFQYTGHGVGVIDVAYLLHGNDDALLDVYFTRLRARLGPDVDATALEAEWRALYPVAQRDFARFLAGWRT